MKLRSIFASMCGNIIEWYDYALFAYLAPILAHQYFPKGSNYTSLLSVFAVFAAGFMMRPLGAIIFGYLGDKLGRAKTLKITMLLISLPSLGMAFLPTYHYWGVLATTILVVFRLFQGLCIGGEFAGSIVYLTEIADDKRRGLTSSTTNNGSNFGLLLALGLSVFLAHLLSEDTFYEIGWRICFFVGGVIGLMGLWLRSYLIESKVFLEAQENLQNRRPLRFLLAYQKKEMLKISLLIIITAGGNYTLMAYFTTYLHTIINLPIAESMRIQASLLILSIIIIPFMAILSDKIGRRVMIIISAIGYITFSIPCFFLLQNLHSIVSMLPLLLFYCCEQGTIPATIVENFPFTSRYTGISLAYNMTMALVGGTAPMINTFLIHYFKNPIMPAAYMSICASISLLVVLFGLRTEYGVNCVLS
ncbi:MAG: MFS transporter [Gammaproteobacteria bacterium]